MTLQETSLFVATLPLAAIIVGVLQFSVWTPKPMADGPEMAVFPSRKLALWLELFWYTEPGSCPRYKTLQHTKAKFVGAMPY